MRIDIITLFPSMFRGPFDESIIKRARKKGILEINLHNLRDFTDDRHRTVDDLPYGGGAGMVMKPEPLFRAVEKVKEEKRSSWKVILLSPQGQPFAQEKAKELAEEEGLIFICGHYEGVDERVREHLIDEELSLGDFVLTGGELAAMVIVDAIARMLPEVLGCKDSIREDSFYQTLLDYPHYTRPAEFRGWKVPGVLISGNHQKIREWRKKKKLENTFKKRPDLLKTAKLSREEEEMLEQIKRARTEH
ncbi:tRNA (guanosine(37)-N1)-methyltransferase TrmD [Candidatus Aerophobetes bacterium]|uniref:tRNA (guanine-N(1)-)-methyltransferase n=1 Tax=Aerophobetes bacterium TaxID=2030807 RepID=A0A523ZI49_UNCAE|nr:MAG: tRNA (guanosine(37)-N1)-methyltransferase TrmD [Candidatus Aerophobetes bacterium]TEU03442.1 MAG: tRNA (guanosine(37)-N1)-methyltransferase TrmD [Candidatus Aerophobetes bacterium]